MPKYLQLCGPITGVPGDWAKPFRDATELLRSKGNWVFSPHEIDGGPSLEKPRSYYMAICLEHMIREARQHPGEFGLVMLPSWVTSRGATTEFLVGSELGVQILNYPNQFSEEPCQQSLSHSPSL